MSGVARGELCGFDCFESVKLIVGETHISLERFLMRRTRRKLAIVLVAVLLGSATYLMSAGAVAASAAGGGEMICGWPGLPDCPPSSETTPPVIVTPAPPVVPVSPPLQPDAPPATDTPSPPEISSPLVIENHGAYILKVMPVCSGTTQSLWVVVHNKQNDIIRVGVAVGNRKGVLMSGPETGFLRADDVGLVITTIPGNETGLVTLLVLGTVTPQVVQVPYFGC